MRQYAAVAMAHGFVVGVVLTPSYISFDEGQIREHSTFKNAVVKAMVMSVERTRGTDQGVDEQQVRDALDADRKMVRMDTAELGTLWWTEQGSNAWGTGEIVGVGPDSYFVVEVTEVVHG